MSKIERKRRELMAMDSSVLIAGVGVGWRWNRAEGIKGDGINTFIALYTLESQ